MHTQVQINSLPVGHTHDDIDQLFSKIAEDDRVGVNLFQVSYFIICVQSIFPSQSIPI